MRNIRTYNQIGSSGLALFEAAHYQAGSGLASADAILLRSHVLAASDIGPEVKAIARAGAGTNNIPVADCTRRGIVVFNTPGANANAVKELVCAGLLLSVRPVCAAMRYVQELATTPVDALKAEIEAGKKRFGGCELKGKTLGIIGLGAIGASVANLALQLGMKVVGHDPALSVEAAWRLSSEVQRADNLSSLLARSDFISLHVPMIEATRHLLNSQNLTAVKRGAHLLNFARGEIVDETAVIAALREGRLAGYVCDFPSAALIGEPGVTLLPHLGASTQEAEDNCAAMAAEQLIEFLDHGNIRNSVNFPAIHLDRTQGYRLTFANDNVPGVLSNVLNLLAGRGINVIDLLNKSRDAVAYSIVDVAQPPTPELLDAIAGVDHVFHVRAV